MSKPTAHDLADEEAAVAVTRAERIAESASDSISGSPSPSASKIVTGARLEGGEIIARGGMGTVHRVFDRQIRRHAAMKKLDPALANLTEARNRFIAEAQITGQLDHPYIVPIYDFDMAEPSFTMKLVDGVTLSSRVSAKHEPDWKRSDDELWELLQAFLKVCDAVSFAHSRGVVHRDLKPDNIMLGTHGQVYVMDWGISCVVGAPGEVESGLEWGVSVSLDPAADVEPTGTIIGSARYMAPEQAWGRIDEIDARTDVFALGGVLYFILTGRPPYYGGSPTHALKLARTGEIPPPTDVARPAFPLSPSLCRIAMKALSADREQRYVSVDALKHEVEQALRGGLWFGSRTFAAGSVVLREGDPPDAAYIITQGRALAYKTIDGQTQRLREMGPGEVFGEMALLGSRPRTASVSAIDELTAIVVTPEALARDLPTGSWLARLVGTLVERLCDLDRRASRPPR